jgi:hypothetical protein
MLLWLLSCAFAIVGYAVVARRRSHTRLQLIAGATLGGGLAGAVFAMFAAALGGASFADLLPFALIPLGTGAFIGAAGVLAFAIGKWLGREP